MANDDNKIFCDKCKRIKRAEEFYGSNNLEKYPEGKLHQCKDCATMFVDNWDPNTYLWILQECDVPYVPDEWNKLLGKYGKDRSSVKGTTIIGRYLSKMKLKQFKDYRWEHTDFLQELMAHKIEETMKRQGYDITDITKVVENRKIIIPAEGFSEPPAPVVLNNDPEEYPELMEQTSAKNNTQEVEDYFAQQYEEDDSLTADLTDEDKRYLRLKWGRAYKPEEWVRLEQLYEEMFRSYDIQGAGHEDTLKLVCKTSLKANQLLDIGDVDGAQKMVKMYDGLMKSGKFTAAQNKAENGEAVDSISEIVEMCEKQGYIERYYIDSPKDKVDLTIKDMQRYTASLIDGETNLSNMIEMALKQNAKEDKEANENTETEIVEDDIDLEDIEKEITDQDFEDFFDFQEEEELSDAELIKKWEEEENNGSH